MPLSNISRDEVGRRGEALYEEILRAAVETPENIGKMIVMDIETQEYAIDDLGLRAARELQLRRPDAILYGKRTGYDVAEAIGGVIQRTAKSSQAKLRLAT
jgi:hypothetical protein